MVVLHVNPELFALVPEPTKEDFESLKKSIQENKQHKPITVWKESVTEKTYIVDGHSRYEACKQLGVEPKIENKEFDNWDDAMLYAVQVNSKRRHLTDMQKVELALREIEIEKKLAEIRQKSTVPKIGQKGFQKLPNGMHTGNTCDVVAAKTGLSSRTVARHKKILDEGSDDLKQKVASGQKSPAAAERQINLEKIHTNPIPLPEGKFRIILCDVPYKYDLEGEGAPNYPTLEKEEIMALKDKAGRPITDVFASDTVIFFWVPPPKLVEALDILNAWGFSYKTKITWSKETDGISQKGVGHYVMSTCEDILIATKGKPGVPEPKNRPLGILRAPRTIHSKKPDMLRHWIEKMYPNQKYLELFARESANGWTAWGDQLDIPEIAKPQTATTIPKKGTLD
ncbi:hypothetical protein YTPLAS73_14540 [Nitrosarchaeum sp.]|nr:hypothetical protein YTPLAS73_14540 [Nitrosarchaeum sp.]